MLKDKIEEFKSKHEGFNFESFLDDFVEGLSREKLCDRWNVTELPLRMFCQQLGLNWIKSKRLSSVEDFRYRLGLENNIGDSVALKEVQRDVERLAEKNRKLYQSLTLARDENNVLRKESRQEAREDAMLDTILDMFQQKIDAMSFTKNEYNFNAEYLAEQELRQGLVGVFSDIHSGQEVQDSVTPFNNYNYEVMEKRMLKVAEEIILFGKQSTNLTMFHLLDDLKGIIHGGLYSTLDGLSTSMLKIVEVYSKVYEMLAPYYLEINIYVTNSNHDRKTEKPSSENKWDNFGIMLAKFLEMILKAKGIKNINFHYTLNDYQLVTINGAKIFAFHGDSLRNFKPYSPTEISKAQDVCMGLFDTTFKHTLNGHFHIANACANQYGGMSISNGTLVGNTEYGTSNGFRSIIPSQTIFFVNKEGNIEDIKILNLSNII